MKVFSYWQDNPHQSKLPLWIPEANLDVTFKSDFVRGRETFQPTNISIMYHHRKAIWDTHRKQKLN